MVNLCGYSLMRDPIRLQLPRCYGHHTSSASFSNRFEKHPIILFKMAEVNFQNLAQIRWNFLKFYIFAEAITTIGVLVELFKILISLPENPGSFHYD